MGTFLRKDDILIIQNSSIQMQSSRSYSSYEKYYKKSSVWDNSTRTTTTTMEGYKEVKNETDGEFSNEKTLFEGESTLFFGNLPRLIAVRKNDGDETFNAHAEAETKAEEDASSENELQTMVKHYQTTHKASRTSLEEKIKTIKQIQRETINYLLYVLFHKDARGVSISESLSRLTDSQEDAASHNTANSYNTTGSYDDIETNDSVIQSGSTVANTTTDVSSSDADLGDVASSSNSLATSENIVATSSEAKSSSVGGSYTTFHYYHETETTGFNTTGTVITADGRELSFNISLEMSRSFTQMASTQIDFGTPRLCDPLVINLDSNIAEVSDQKFLFDIDADGEEESISMLSSSSGYLALDKNEDGIVNDGNELFGTQSGNGFYDLLQYDEDGNGWIDEADGIFQKLQIWQMSEDGTSKLIDLKDASVGAIYLGYEDTKFSLNDTQNQTNAVIQKTGLFLYENGYSGTIQQMDLAV